MGGDQDPAQLFAAYVEVTKVVGPHRRRRQWMILPPMPARLAPGDSPITFSMSWFERTQRASDHRATWRFNIDTSGAFRRNLMTTLENLEADDWKLTIPDGGMLTCEVHPTELAQILKDRKTPYRLLSRSQKVARSMYGLDIS